MGNRAIITLEDENNTLHPVALYVQWNGGLESIEAFLQVAWEAPRNSNSIYDFHISLCQLLRNYWPDGYCLYGYPCEDAIKWGESCDNGHYRYRFYQSKAPKLVRWTDKPKGMKLAECTAKARQHEYWTVTDNIIADLKSVMPKNTFKD